MISQATLVIVVGIIAISIITAVWIGFNMGYKAKTGESVDMPIFEIKTEAPKGKKPEDDEPKSFYE